MEPRLEYVNENIKDVAQALERVEHKIDELPTKPEIFTGAALLVVFALVAIAQLTELTVTAGSLHLRCRYL